MANPAPPPKGKLLAQLDNCRVLVAEDDRINQLAIQRLLQQLNCTPVTVSNGREAVSALARALSEGHPFDAVLMDIQMPDMDGLEATRRIRDPQNPAYSPDLPIIAVTAFAMTGDRETFLQAGMDEFLAKPLDLGALATVLQRFMGE